MPTSEMDEPEKCLPLALQSLFYKVGRRSGRRQGGVGGQAGSSAHGAGRRVEAAVPCWGAGPAAQAAAAARGSRAVARHRDEVEGPACAELDTRQHWGCCAAGTAQLTFPAAGAQRGLHAGAASLSAAAWLFPSMDTCLTLDLRIASWAHGR
jgi:hypothetical protein